MAEAEEKDEINARAIGRAPAVITQILLGEMNAIDAKSQRMILLAQVVVLLVEAAVVSVELEVQMQSY